MVGTYRWCAPEIINKLTNKTWSEKADIFSLGIVLFEIASQLLPFADEDDTYTVVEMMRKGERPNIPKECSPIVRFPFIFSYLLL
jgi:serine/threonine protein kinase